MYLIIGGSGFLGRYVIKNVLELTGERVTATYSSREPVFSDSRLEWRRLDICDTVAIRKLHGEFGNDLKIVYLAAYHHPDKVEENPELAWARNIIALAEFVNIFAKAQSLYFSSTDSVYGEGDKDRKFSEHSPLNPVNTYGRHKVLAEHITQAKDFNVIRFPFMFGPSLIENKRHFFDEIKADLAGGKTVEMFDDSYRSTLSFNQCARLLVALMENSEAKKEKVLNAAGDEVMSKYDAGLRLARKYMLDEHLLQPVSVRQNSRIFIARRAGTAVLDNSRLKALLGLKTLTFEI